MYQQSDREAARVARSHDGLTAQIEAGLLTAIAQRLPARIVPDNLTVLGVVGALLAFFGLVAMQASTSFAWLALFGLALNWLGDSLDGTLARIRRIERPRYGFFVDHVSDVISQFLIVMGLGLSPLMRFDIAALALLGYLGLSIYTFVRLHVTRSMQISYFGVGPTEVRLLIAAGVSVVALTDMPLIPAGLFGELSLIDAGGLLVFVFAVITFAVMFRQDLQRLAQIDPPRHVMPAEIPIVDVTPAQLQTTMPSFPARNLS